MPITAETFESEHFEKLLRGLHVASEAFEERGVEIQKLEDQRAEQDDLVTDLRAEIDNLRSQLRPWEQLTEFIADVERGIHTLDELYERVREMGGVYA